jgi:hypothetical protein
MISFRTSADVDANRQVVVNLPPETPIGKADLVVTVMPHQTTQENRGLVRRYFGAFQSGNPRAGDNESIDVDLEREYGGTSS